MGLICRRRFLVALLIPVVAAPVVLGRILVKWRGADAVVDGREEDQEQLMAPAFHLDEVPGFGRSELAVARDETIALYESWQRDRRVAQCLRADPARRRQREAMCSRRAGRDGPRIWSLRDQLFDELLEAQTDHVVKSATFRRARGPFDECVTRHLGQTVAHIKDLEAALLSAEDADAAEECFVLWERAAAPAVEQSLRVFVARHHQRLAAQIRLYEGAIEAIGSDRKFVRWLRRELQPR